MDRPARKQETVDEEEEAGDRLAQIEAEFTAKFERQLETLRAQIYEEFEAEEIVQNGDFRVRFVVRFCGLSEDRGLSGVVALHRDEGSALELE
jgi:hypothetical protein